MPTAKLLSRETISNQSLTSVVERSQSKKPPFQDYDLRLTSNQLELLPISKPNQYIKPISPDEGFESDIDTLSIISSDDSFASSTCMVEDHVLKHRENDSANGSSSSDSDTEILTTRLINEYHVLTYVLCYTDVKFPKVLVFCIKDTVLVFSFENVDNLQQFYTSFNTLKAVSNQRTYAKNLGAKFNLLHRTDNNGITHIEISREAATRVITPQVNSETSSIISISAPDTIKAKIESKLSQLPEVKKAETLRFIREKPQLDQKLQIKSFDDSRVTLQSELKTSRSEFFPSNGIQSFTLHPRKFDDTRLEALPIQRKDESTLRKVWKSAEDLLDAPKRPERKRKPKGKAPPPPIQDPKQNIMKGQFVRVAVDPKRPLDKPVKMEEPPNFQTFSPNVQTFTPNWTTLRQSQSPLILTTNQKGKPYPKLTEYKKSEMTSKNTVSWTNSVPRLLKKPRSKSETRGFTPMAYRYIDTTRPQTPFAASNGTISNRLFGLSQKLKEFSTNVVQPSRNFYSENGERRNSVGEMTYKLNNDSNLKSVIKKDDKKGRNDKKVTFSAYATVQVV